MTNCAACENNAEVPAEVLSCPALLFLYYRVEQILGIRASVDALIALNKYLEETCKGSFIKNPAAYEYLLTSREQIFDISKFLTVNETYFFREGAHFNLLASLLPELIRSGRTLRICCAAVSIGCEAYSIAMLLDHQIKNGLNFDYNIDAFDVNINSVETAKNARFSENSLRTDGSAWKNILNLYLIKENGFYNVSHEIKNKVNFFPHNIMRGLDKQYDIIFFRNSLIYFTPKNRLTVLTNISESLFTNGLLFLGVSETSSVKHPLLASRYKSDVFYFQKISSESIENTAFPDNIIKVNADRRNRQNSQYKQILPKKEEIFVDCGEITNILKDDDGRQNSDKVLSAFKYSNLSSFSGANLVSCIITLLNMQNLENAEKILEHLEKNNSSVFTRFLRAEYYFLSGIAEEAEKFYHEAAVKDKFFWPAFYRIAIIASEGNRTRFEYKAKKTLESIDLWQKLEPDNRINYECFMGGFSPDYFKRILENKLL
ncbi:MAG: hypothetical protein FWD28_02920 [Treponema sp.]|nr:hypothetical protein [Treponema sp.]